MKRRFVRFLLPLFLIAMVLTLSFLFFRESHAAGPNGTTVVAVHGINSGDGLWNTSTFGDDTMPHCSSYWEDARSFLQDRWGSDFRQIGFYHHDCSNNGSETGLSADLHDANYVSHCTSFASGNDGNNNESIDHLACLLGWYLYNNFGQYQREEILIGHSMGGIIIRKTLELVQQHDRHLPSTIGHVKQVFTFSTPQAGHFMAGLMCTACLQGRQLDSTSSFINDLNNHGQNPQAGGHTEWVLIGSPCDGLVGIGALRMQANAYYWYNGSLCYDHGNIIHDGRLAHIMTLTSCIPSTPNSNDCSIDFFGNLVGKSWHTRTATPHSLDLLFEAISGITV